MESFSKLKFFFIIIFLFCSKLNASEEIITYQQILENPGDLKLNLKYAKQESEIGNYKQTISTLERLNIIYPENIEIKLYLLSILVQIDSPQQASTLINDIKLLNNLSPDDLETVLELEAEISERNLDKLWSVNLDLSGSGLYTDNVNSVSKTRLQNDSDAIIGFNKAKYDRTLSGDIGVSVSRDIGEESSIVFNLSHGDSEQYSETDDDFETYNFTTAFDTQVADHNISPYIILGKTDYQDDADSFSYIYGFGGNTSIGNKYSLSYGYSFADSKNNNNSSDLTANQKNSITHSYSIGLDTYINDIVSTSIGLGYSDSDAKVDDGNDYETYDLSLRVNLALPWAFISFTDSVSFNDYKKADASINSKTIRSDYTNTFDITFTKSIGDLFPNLDPNRSLLVNFSYEKLISEANIINYDYITDSFTLTFSKSLNLY